MHTEKKRDEKKTSQKTNERKTQQNNQNVHVHYILSLTSFRT